MTVNKAMGQTLSRVAVDLRIPVFSHGQLYVALGRVCRRGDALVVVDEERKHNENGRIILLNKVCRDLLV
jgi:ATP-dependent DNA helicase PIF1